MWKVFAASWTLWTMYGCRSIPSSAWARSLQCLLLLLRLLVAACFHLLSQVQLQAAQVAQVAQVPLVPLVP